MQVINLASGVVEKRLTYDFHMSIKWISFKRLGCKATCEISVASASLIAARLSVSADLDGVVAAVGGHGCFDEDTLTDVGLGVVGDEVSSGLFVGF